MRPRMPHTADPITPDVVAAHGLSEEEYARVLHALGREPNLVELGIFSVMWSEHCSYKSSRLHLKKLPTEAPWVICGPGENAGVIDIGDNQACIFKMESHNHPSYIEPYQGAATGVGGILRDVFTMGARPIANLNALRFGRPDHPKTRHLVAGVVAGIGGWFGYPELSFQMMLGYVFAPIFRLLGAPDWAEAMRAGGFFGTKLVLNEFVAFIDLGQAKDLSQTTQGIVTFALCGFANFSSIAIQMAVTGGLAPNQRPVIARLGLKALAAGSLSNLMSAALAGLFLSL